jgi:hypothetical protein
MVKTCFKKIVVMVLIEVLSNDLPKSNIQCFIYTKTPKIIAKPKSCKINQLWHFCSILFWVVVVPTVHVNGRKLSYVG